MKSKIKLVYLYNFALLICILKEFFIVSVSWNLADSTLQSVLSALNYIFILTCFLLYIVELLVFRDYIYYLLCVPISVFVFYISQHVSAAGEDIVFSVFLILLAKNLSLNKIVNFLFRVILIGTFIVVVGSFLHITNNIAINFPYGTGYSYGFGHPNTSGIVLVNILFMWIYLHPNIDLKYVFILSYIVFSIIWFVAKARTSGMIAGLVPWGVLAISQMNESMKKRISLILIPLVLVLFAFSFYLMIEVGRKIWNMSSGFDMRFNYAYYVLSYYGIHLFGSRVPLVSTVNASIVRQRALVLDSAYLRMLLLNGVLPTIIMGTIVIILFYRCYKNKSFLLLLIAVLYLSGAFMEHYFAYSWYNFTLIATFANLLSSSNDYNFKNKKEHLWKLRR